MTTALHHPRRDIHDYTRELTATHTHTETVETTRGGTTYRQPHTTDVPPLLHQLRYARPSGLGDERTGSGFESRPAASLEAMNTLARIDTEVTRWLNRLDVRVAADATAADALRKLAAQHPRLLTWNPDAAHVLASDVRRWWAAARVVTGWDSPAWRPDATCPMCSTRGGLRVKLGDQVGLCAECHETWGPGNIGLLADHIRTESWSERPAPVMSECWCPWPRPPFVFVNGGRWALCRTCGTRTCHRATPAA